MKAMVVNSDMAGSATEGSFRIFAGFVARPGRNVAAIPASSRTRRLSSLLTGSMIRASTRWRKISSPRRRVFESQHPVHVLQRVQQVPHPRGRDRQRAAARGLKTQAKLQLASGQPLPGSGLQRLQPGLVVRRAQVLDLARAPPRRVHDLHRCRADFVFTVLTYGQATLRGTVSAQLQLPERPNQQVTASGHREFPNPLLRQVRDSTMVEPVEQVGPTDAAQAS